MGMSSLECSHYMHDRLGLREPPEEISAEVVRRLERAGSGRHLSADPARTVAIEDLRNGILSAKTAGMRVVAIPNVRYSPDEQTLIAADVVLPSLELTPATTELSAAP